MTFHLVQTECPEYPPFAGEFLVEIILGGGNQHYIDCPPFKRAAYQATHDPVDEILRAYLKEQGATLVAYWPVIYKQLITELPTTMQPVCYIDCTFGAGLAKKLTSTDKYYRCQLPAACPTLLLTYKIEISVQLKPGANIDTWSTHLANEISPERLVDMIMTHWAEYALIVKVDP